MAAIPTTYKGINMRSLAEARWAAFFDELSWKWSYEPIELDGYIPDFILDFPAGKVLVEVKGVWPSSDLGDEEIWRVKYDAAEKIEASGWKGCAIILLAEPFRTLRDGKYYWFDCFEVGSECGWGCPSEDLQIGRCWECNDWTLNTSQGNWKSLNCGHEESRKSIKPDNSEVEKAWSRAKNKVQWKGRGA
jgi:hypothetical protein